jgi:hypothetical protein
MSYEIDPNAAATANYQAFIALKNAELQSMVKIGQLLDHTFNAVWNPPAPATPQGIAAVIGANFLPRLATHAALATILLQQEAANGIDSSKHPWAVATVNQGPTTYAPGIPGWTVTPTLDANGNPTGAATVTPST